jgi:hypothetical protein
MADLAEMKWTSKSHWTSGSHRGCPFNFKWCTADSYFYNNSINWQSGQPNNAFNQQECVQMMLNTGAWAATTYDDQPCSFLSYYICEVLKFVTEIAKQELAWNVFYLRNQFLK